MRNKGAFGVGWQVCPAKINTKVKVRLYFEFVS
jgi:hypothetical protein